MPIIESNESFFASLNGIKGVCVIGLSYNDIDFPYLKEVAERVSPDCKWVLNYYSKDDKINAGKTVSKLSLTNYSIEQFK